MVSLLSASLSLPSAVGRTLAPRGATEGGPVPDFLAMLTPTADGTLALALTSTGVPDRPSLAASGNTMPVAPGIDPTAVEPLLSSALLVADVPPTGSLLAGTPPGSSSSPATVAPLPATLLGTTAVGPAADMPTPPPAPVRATTSLALATVSVLALAATQPAAPILPDAEPAPADPALLSPVPTAMRPAPPLHPRTLRKEPPPGGRPVPHEDTTTDGMTPEADEPVAPLVATTMPEASVGSSPSVSMPIPAATTSAVSPAALDGTSPSPVDAPATRSAQDHAAADRLPVPAAAASLPDAIADPLRPAPGVGRPAASASIGGDMPPPVVDGAAAARAAPATAQIEAAAARGSRPQSRDTGPSAARPISEPAANTRGASPMALPTGVVDPASPQPFASTGASATAPADTSASAPQTMATLAGAAIAVSPTITPPSVPSSAPQSPAALAMVRDPRTPVDRPSPIASGLGLRSVLRDQPNPALPAPSVLAPLVVPEIIDRPRFSPAAASGAQPPASGAQPAAIAATPPSIAAPSTPAVSLPPILPQAGATPSASVSVAPTPATAGPGIVPAPVAAAPVATSRQATDAPARIVARAEPALRAMAPSILAAADPAAAPLPDAMPSRPRSEPAFRAFATAMFDASRDPAAPISGIAAPATAAPIAAAAQPPLDLTQSRWPQAMVDRIERLRDDAAMGDTRIRLIPDALGTIDVSLRREGETVHVAFRAEQAETRQILADARHELGTLAEQRGIRLGDTAVAPAGSTQAGGWSSQPQTGANSAGGERAPRQQPQSSTPAAPPRAAMTAADEGDDIRIA